MPNSIEWESKYRQELHRGIAARAEGNEGMARVCARRAAGVIARAHFERTVQIPAGMSVLNLLRTLRDSEDAADSVRELAGFFILQITEDHQLPGDIDLLAAAEKLRENLFPAA